MPEYWFSLARLLACKYRFYDSLLMQENTGQQKTIFSRHTGKTGPRTLRGPRTQDPRRTQDSMRTQDPMRTQGPMRTQDPIWTRNL